MARLLAVLFLLVTLAAGAQAFASGGSSAIDPVADRIRRLVTDSASGAPRVHGEALASHADVRRFYQQRAYTAAWEPSFLRVAAAGSLMAELASAEAHGLAPSDYHHGLLQTLARRVAAAPLGVSVLDRAALDVLLTDAFLTLATHRMRGRVDPRRLHTGWTAPLRSEDLVALLQSAIEGGDVAAALRSLDPPGAEYATLRSALEYYNALGERGWPELPDGKPLRAEGDDPRVTVLLERLALEAGALRGSLEQHWRLVPGPPPWHGNPEQHWRLVPGPEQVRAFQRAHGLEDDGVVGPVTRRELNVPAAHRARQIALSIERLRWLAGMAGQTHVRIALPAFELHLLEGGRTVMVRRIIGGRADWPTPVFGSAIEAVVFSPYWNVPARIAALEVLPKVRRDPGWLARVHMRVLAGWGADAREVDTSSIDWRHVTASSFRYRFRQDPGPGNPLGGVKFLIDNPWDVYLHDTSEPSLFGRPLRAFSHGCMRLEEPLDLADYLLRGDTVWTRATIEAAAHAGKERTVQVHPRVPLHVVYRTAWVDQHGALQFREDIYGHDARLARLLEHRPPTMQLPLVGGYAAARPAGCVVPPAEQ